MILSPDLQTLSKFHQLSHSGPFPGVGYNSKSHVHLVVLPLWQVLHLPLSFMTLTLKRVLISYFAECSSIWDSLMVPWVGWDYAFFFHEGHTNGFIQHVISYQCVSSVCVVTGAVDCGPVVRTVPLGFFHHKLTLFSFLLNRYLRGRFCDTMQISCFSWFFCPLILASIDGSWLLSLFLWYWTNGDLEARFFFSSSMYYSVMDISLFNSHFVFRCSDCSRFGHWEVLLVGSCVFSTCPRIF